MKPFQSATGEDEIRPLSAADYLRAERIYPRVMAACCLRKPGALKLRQEIDVRIANGEPDRAILTDLSRRFGGQAARFDEAQDNTSWFLTPLIVTAAAAALVEFSRRARNIRRNPPAA
jgi:hypothetical protein